MSLAPLTPPPLIPSTADSDTESECDTASDCSQGDAVGIAGIDDCDSDGMPIGRGNCFHSHRGHNHDHAHREAWEASKSRHSHHVDGHADVKEPKVLTQMPLKFSKFMKQDVSPPAAAGQAKNSLAASSLALMGSANRSFAASSLANANSLTSNAISSPPAAQNGEATHLDCSEHHAEPPEGFVLNGHLSLFGIESLVADFFSYHGPLLDDIPQDDGVVPIYQMAMLEKDLRISTFVPSFANTPFDKFALKNATFVYQNLPIDLSRMVGFTMEADIDIDSSYGGLHDVLCNVFGLNSPSVHLSAGLGDQNWHRPVWLPSFQLTGLLHDAEPKPPCSQLQFTGLGATLTGYHHLYVNEKGKTVEKKQFGFGLFGTMHVVVPWSPIPLEMMFSMEESSGYVTLQAAVEGRWEGAFGVKQLTLDEVSMTMDFDPKKPLKSLAFDVSAIFEFGETSVQLTGSYASGGDYELVATFQDLGFAGLSDIFNHFFNDELTIPDIDLHIGSASIVISKSAGFLLSVYDLTVGDFHVNEGEIVVGRDGISLKADIDGKIIKLDEIEIKEAFIKVDFGRKSKKSSTSILLGGKFAWQHKTFDVGVHLYKSQKTKGLQYTVYGDFVADKPENGVSLADLIPEVKDSFLKDVRMEGAAIIIASNDDAEFGTLTHTRYSVRKGIQFCAVLSDIPGLKTLLRVDEQTSLGLVLRAGWSPKEGFSVDMIFPHSMVIDFGKGCMSDPIMLRLVLAKVPQLKVIGGLSLPVAGRDTPLHFIIDVDIDVLGASLTGQLSAPGGWNNPFGISKEITIGPDLALKISILYATFLVQGPSGLGAVGGLQIGKVSGQVAFNIDERVDSELLYASVKHLDLEDVVIFANKIVHAKMAVPKNIINFKEASIYICPSGVTIGTIVYPPGFSFTADLEFFGVNGSAHVAVDITGVIGKGTLKNFKLGPLVVKGTKGPSPSFDLELSSSKQQVTVDGLIEFLGSHISVACHLGIMPSPAFDFFFDLDFTNLYTFQVKGSPVKPVDKPNASIIDTDYRLEAEFHDKIRNHISKQLDKLFDIASRENMKAFEAAHVKLEEARTKYRKDLDSAQKKFDSAHAAWLRKRDAVHKERDRVAAENDRKLDEEQRRLDAAKRKARADEERERERTRQARADRDRQTASCTRNIENTKNEWERKINNAKQKITDAQRAVDRAFGDADRAVQRARDKVNGLQRDINNVDRDLSSCYNASWWNFPKKAQIPYYLAKKGTLWASKKIADGALWLAQQALRGGAYVTNKGILENAKRFLDTTKSAGDAAIKGAYEALDTAKRLCQRAIDLAEDAWSKAKELGRRAVELAQDAWLQVKRAGQKALEYAQRAVDKLVETAEWLAYQSATGLLKAAKEAGSALITMADGIVSGAKFLTQTALRAWQFIMRLATGFIVVTDVVLTGEAGKLVGGASFAADVKGTAAGIDWHINIHWDTRDVDKFIQDIFVPLLELVANGLIDVCPAMKLAIKNGVVKQLLKV